jgi:hypothetical protein
VEIRERLIGLGYSEEIFHSNLMCSVQIDEKENILEKYKLSMRYAFFYLVYGYVPDPLANCSVDI